MSKIGRPSVKKQAIIKYFNKGYSVTNIANKVGANAGYVSRVVRAHRVEQVEEVAERDFNNLVVAFKKSPEPDMVNNPPHYTVGGIETIDYMKAKSTPEEFRGHLRLTTLKYLSRVGYKGEDLEDYKKAAWYLNRLIKFVETGE